MKYKVERCLECARSWVVLDELGRVVHETSVWAWAVDDAIARYNAGLQRTVRVRVSVDEATVNDWFEALRDR